MKALPEQNEREAAPSPATCYLASSAPPNRAPQGRDTQRTEVQEIAAKVVLLDRLFVVYGPEATDARALFRNNMIAAVERVWPTDRSRTVDLNPLSDRLSTQSYVERLRGLSPASEVQRAILAQALQLSTSIGQTQLLMYAQAGGTVSAGLLVVLVFWISVLFLGFGLFARANAMVMGALFVGALSASGAIFLILDLDEPYTGPPWNLMHRHAARGAG